MNSLSIVFALTCMFW